MIEQKAVVPILRQAREWSKPWVELEKMTAGSRWEVEVAQGEEAVENYLGR